MNCLNSEHLVGYIEEFLNEQAKEHVEKHIRTCTECRSRLKKFLKLRNLFVKCAEMYKGKVQVREELLWFIRDEEQSFSVGNLDEKRCYKTLVGKFDPVANPDPEVDGEPVEVQALVAASISNDEANYMNSAQGHSAEEKEEVDRDDHDSTVEVSFAMDKTGIEPDEKQIIASWISHQLPLRDEAGLVIDSGSSCLEMWKEIVAQIELGHCGHMLVYTNSYPILEYWRKHLHNPHVLGTKVELYGSSLDPDHLAFFGSENNISDVSEKLMSKDFQPMHVFIGTSGIRFNSRGRILFGYHAEERELVIKKLLFQRPADARIILAAPSKIGFTGGRTFDVLEVYNLSNAPIYLVTTSPPENQPEITRRFEEALEMFTSPAMEEAIGAHEGLEFHWIILDRNTRELPKMKKYLTVPKNAHKSLEL